MKKILLLLTAVFVLLACSRKTITTAETKVKEPAAASSFDVQAIAQGKVVYTNRCGRCHGLKPVQRYTQQEWETILNLMIRKARLQAIDSANVTAYVFSNAKKA